MPLIDLKTNLKDLKFGKDQYRGGDSGQPFIATRIPATDEPLQTATSISGPDVVQTIGSTLISVGAGAAIGALLGPVGAVAGAAAGLGIGVGSNIDQGNSVSIKFPTAGTGGPDFLLRGGSLVANYVADDYNRLSKFFKGTNGIFFTLKQNLLSRLGTRAQGSPILLNERLYTPISTILGAVGSPFGLHVNKQGLNPFQGIGQEYTPDRYFTAMADDINIFPNNGTSNRLTALYMYKVVSPNQRKSLISKEYSIADNNNTVLLQYGGGPGSFLGIGKTNINYATDYVGNPLKVSNATTDNTLDYQELEDIVLETANGERSLTPYTPIIVDFRNNLKKLISISPSYNQGDGKTLEVRTNLGDPGNDFGGQKNIINYTYGYALNGTSSVDTGSYTSLGASSPYSYDKINVAPIYRTTSSADQQYNDLINFRIGVINNNNSAQIDYIHFRAFLDKISDSYKASWKETNYIGRGEDFYIYTGFSRKVSLSWTVAAQSKIELIPMYRKLNYLASLCAPDYSNFGFMRGNIIKLTIGDYFYEQPGIVTGFNYEMNDDADSWEIGIDYEGNIDQSVRQVPHIIKVSSFDFIPIHEFVPRKQQNFYGGKGQDSGRITQYGKEHFIALKNNTGNSSYNDPVYLDLDKNI